MLDVIEIFKSYEGAAALQGVSFRVNAAETVCLLGPSGSGKSTLLHIIAGLERADSGRILWDKEDISSMPAHLRRFGLVFQDYALFPHLNVLENVAFGLRMQGYSRAESSALARETLERVRLRGFESRRVTDLSGGEQQRVALARALAPRPRLLMFDEPLGALDRALRETLLSELREILHEAQAPAIYVTHDQEEAFALADRLILLRDGRVIQDGAPSEVYARPVSAWAAEFLGLGTTLKGRINASGKVETAAGVVDIACPRESVSLLIRPEGASLSRKQGCALLIRSRVADVVFRQRDFRVILENGVYVYLPHAPARGETVSVCIPPEAIQCL